MQELLNRVMQQAGIDETMAKPAIGAVLNMLKSVLPAEQVQSILAMIPGAEGLMSEAETQTSGGMAGMLGGALSSVTGGSVGGVTQALGQLQSLGLDTDQSKSVGNAVLGFVKENAPEDLRQTIESKLPTF